MARERLGKLPFRTRGKVPPGCNYVVVAWVKGKSQRRRIVSCHRSAGAARQAYQDYSRKEARRAASPFGRFGLINIDRYGVYSLKTGKRIV